MATDYDNALRMQVHYLPLFFQPKARRGQPQRIWIESASVRTATSPNDRTLLLRYCTNTSPLFIEIYVDASTGLVYTESSNPAVSTICEIINNSARQRGATRLLTPLLATISREIQLGMEKNLLWPTTGPLAWVPSQRSPIESVIVDIFRGLLHHPVFDTVTTSSSTERKTSLSAVQKGQAIIDGLGQQISLLTTALYTVRRLLICKPLPHWIMQANSFLLNQGTGTTSTSASSSSSSSFLAAFSSSSTPSTKDSFVSSPSSASDVSSPHSTTADFDTQTLDKSIGGLGSLRSLLYTSSSSSPHSSSASSSQFTEGTISSHSLSLLPLESLLLLYWLLALAPVRLIRTVQPVIPEANASYIVVHGAFSSSWITNNHHSTDNGIRSPTGSNAPYSFASDTAIQEPLWDTYAAQKYRTYYTPSSSSTVASVPTHQPTTTKDKEVVRWFHGTSTDNAYSAMSFGLRSLSGTRHQSSGAMYGDGIYVTNSVNVAQSFAKPVGLAWAGYSTAIGAIATHAYGTSSTTSHGSSTTTMVQNASRTHTKPCTQRIILEMDVIADPENKIMVDGKDITKEVNSGSVPLPPAVYLIVKDPLHLWMKAIHVYDDEAPIVLTTPNAVTPTKILNTVSTPKGIVPPLSSSSPVPRTLSVQPSPSSSSVSNPSTPVQDIYQTRTLDNADDAQLLSPVEAKHHRSFLQRSLWVLIIAIVIAYITSSSSVHTWLQGWMQNAKQRSIK